MDSDAAVWEVLTNQSAYQGLHYGAVVERVIVQGHRPAIPEYVPEGFAILMQSCWDADSEKRPTFDQIVTCLELMVDNLSSDGSSNGSGGHAINDGELVFPSSSTSIARSFSGAAAAAVANHLQQRPQPLLQQQPQVVVPLLDVTSHPSAPGSGKLVGSSTAGSQQHQPLTPRHDHPHHMRDKIVRLHDGPGSTAQSTHSGSRGSRLAGHAPSTIDANQFVQDL